MRLLRPLPLLLALAIAGFAAEPVAAYAAAEVLEQADRQNLGEDREWLTLLHVERGWHGIRRSLVDDPAFFLAPNGKYDPTAELHATLAMLLAPPPATGRNAFDRFPARCEFLVRRLGLDRARLPMPRSTEFEQAYAGLGPRSAAIAFPTAFMNSPGSMFGHTLLVVRSRMQAGMASQAISYAAATGNDGGLAFAIKGIFGGYPGLFSLVPYWQKLSEYADIDQRDVWEYELDLSEPEIRLMLEHVWELRGIASDYYFFDENCAYVLLYLLDVARPGLDLHRRASPWVIPLDTVNLMVDAGIVREVLWRPGMATKIKARARRLPPERAERARRIALGELPAAAAVDGDAAASADELDLAADFLQARRNIKKVEQAEFQQRFMLLLLERSRIALPSREAITDPGDVSPDHGHRSLRLGLGGGWAGGKEYGEFTVRPAYHDLLDPAPGYVTGAAIDFCSLTLRWYDGDPRPVLERLDVIGLRSFAPRDGFFKPWSWKVDTGLVREWVHDDGHSQNHAFVDFGIGLTWPLPGGGLIYGLADADLRVVDADPSLALGLGPEVGAVIRLGRFAVQPQARWESFVGELPGDNWRVGLSGSVTLAPSLSLALDAWRQRTWDFETTVLGARLQAYF